MNPLDLIGKVVKLVGKVTGVGFLKEAGDFLAGDEGKAAIAALPPEQQAQIQAAILEHEQAMRALDIEELKTVVSESLAEIQSADKYTSRARPTGVYAATAITAAMSVGLLFGVTIPEGAIVSLLTPLWGNAVWYTYNRTKEKTNGKVR